MIAYYIFCLWLFLDIVALELISRRKNGMADIWEMYSEWKNITYIGFKILTIVYLIGMLPLTIPASIFKIIKKNKRNE